MIAALYVETNGAYYGLPGIDPWDEQRDARRYDGPHPVVAHPPCQRWGKLWAGQPLWIKRTGERKKKGDDGGCFEAALNAVRRFGGVIEHPWQSHAWKHFGLKTPPRSGGWVKADEYGGWTCCVEQGRYGHYARKPTMLYAVGVELPELEWGESEMRLDPAVVERMGLKRAKRLGEVGARGGGQNSTPRIHTPTEFRGILLAMAMSAKNVLKNANQDYTKECKRDMNNETSTTNPKENRMSYELKITASNAQEFAQDIVTLAFMVAPHLKDRLVASTAPAPIQPVADTVVEPVEEVKKPARKSAAAKKAETIEHDETEVKADVHAETSIPDGDGTVGVSTVGDEETASDEVPAEAETSEPVADTPAESVAKNDEPSLTIDEMRKYTIEKYLNVVFTEMPDRSAAFKSLLKRPEFNLEKIADLPVEKINAFKAAVDVEISQFNAKKAA